MILSRGNEFNYFFKKRLLKKVYMEKFLNSKLRGMDGVDSNKFDIDVSKNIDYISKGCLQGGYSFIPYLELLKSKGRGKAPRAIAIPSLRDRIVLYQVKEYLTYKFKDESKQELANTIVARLISYYKSDLSFDEYSVIKIDVVSFYDAIPHDHLFIKLREKIKSKKAVEIIKTAVSNHCLPLKVKAKDNNKNIRGVHQGLAISNVLASIYLNDFDEKYKNSHEVEYFRYVDDILILCKKDIADFVYKNICQDMLDMGLVTHKINEGKTSIINATEKFDYLGYVLENGVVSVRNSSIQRFIDGVARIVTGFKYNKKNSINVGVDAAIAVEELNEKISGAYSEGRRYGWIAFFGQINDIKLLGQMDYSINKIISKDADLRLLISKIKTLRRSIFEMKYRVTNGYVHNYDSIVTVAEKLRYLVKRGVYKIDSDVKLSVSDIEKLYEKTKDKYLYRLEMDDALRS